MAISGVIEALIAVTLLGAFAVFLAPDEWAGKAATAVSLVPVAGSLWMYANFDGSGNALLESGSLAFESTLDWVALGPYVLSWHVGVDGVSMPLVLLTTVLMLILVPALYMILEDAHRFFLGGRSEGRLDVEAPAE